MVCVPYINRNLRAAAGFVLGLIAAVVVTLCTKEPSKEVYELFDKAEKFDE